MSLKTFPLNKANNFVLLYKQKLILNEIIYEED